MSLTPRQRKHLKALAHSLEPVVRIGKGGVTNSVVAEAARSIDSHELIKVRVDEDDGAVRRKMAAALATAVQGELVATIGKIGILYRPRAEKPKIKLP